MVSTPHEYLGLRYLRVATTLKKMVLEGVYRPGDRFPPQHNLAKEHNVSFTTMKKALDMLEQEGYVVRKVGDGTYAALPAATLPVALVVDDDENIRSLFARVLAANEWKSVEAASGRAAIEKLKEAKFDLMFLDLAMPEMNSVDTFRQMRKEDPGAYVVIVTEYLDSALMAEALDIGPFALMKKPFTLADLGVVLGQTELRLDMAVISRGSGGVDGGPDSPRPVHRNDQPVDP